MATKKVLRTATIGLEGTPEAIVLNPIQARFLLGLLLDPAEVAQIVNHLAVDCGLAPEVIDIAPSPQPTPTAPKPELKPEPKVAPALATKPTPSTPEPAPKVKATRKPRKAKTAPTVVIVDTINPVVGISDEQGKPLPSPTATCTVSRPSQTPDSQSGTGVEKITSAAIERETLNERDLVDLRQRAKEIGVTGAIHKMKAETLRARIALAETALAEKPVAVAAPVAVQPVAVKPARKLVADFLNVLPDGRELYTAVYSDGSIENELSEATSSAAA